MYGWDWKKVVGHYPKIKMMQIKWDGPKWKWYKFNDTNKISLDNK